ncbi:TBC domain-containing protein kinase-like protein isoform X2 [Zootermopsis nevadensis]|uniref:TBC domain-containing protein kinase-like protein isoform X2 n=1 Tax=Zootermopsis nevadensis TaxID=136037 RepID=UPI000B8E5EA5|nr:TBC domain-containing protein kinase-like protein isoform X2 [Zootermopsis nevadensis]
MSPVASPTIGTQFGGLTFFAQSHPGELCGSNGLPLTPNSITIFGQAQFLKTISHPYLCSYLDIIRGKHERTMVVSEYLPQLVNSRPLSLDEVISIASQTLQALNYLNELGIVHRSLCPENIVLTDRGHIQLFNYGLYYMTNGGMDVSFPIGHPKYLAPEVYLGGRGAKSGSKVDVWSLGMIILELALGKQLWSDLKLAQCMRKVLSLLHIKVSVLERLAREHGCWEDCQEFPAELHDFISKCLSVSPCERPTPRQLLRHPLFQDVSQVDVNKHSKEEMQYQVFPGFQSHRIPVYQNVKHPLLERSLQELYYLWHLAGGDVQAELKKQGLIRTKAPILSIPNLVLLEGTVFGQVRDQTSMLDLRVVPLPLDTLYQRLVHVPLTSYYPLVEIKSEIISKEDGEQLEAASLPLIIRERDTEYQFHRIVLYDRLIKGYPYKKAAILKEAHKDIPPLYRGHIWAALLEVDGDVDGYYVAVDKETPTHTDRQIEVDIPRCHQYDELLSSCEGHRKFRRVLKAWVVSHPQYVYWQGLDSLCAPFLYLNFNNEAQAFACLSAFIPKYLHNFFLKDNTAVIQEYLAKFSHLIAFHDPALENHLVGINFIPELFAIPWFLTMFSHVFPLHKIFHLWDKLLLGDASFPLYIGLAILQQLRDTLLESGFNECILLFSDLPEIDMERCVTDSIELYCSTPRSVTYRQHELQPDASADNEINTELVMSPLPVAELQSELCPRISGADLLELLQKKKSKVVTVDIRAVEEYSRGTVAGSIHIPWSSASVPELSTLQASKGRIIVILGAHALHSAQFGKHLVQNGFARVCCLHRGIQVLRSTDVLIVPGAM